MNLKVPTRCPQQRHKDRMSLRNPRILSEKNCLRCEKALLTTYSLNSPEIVYCEECYLAATV